MDINKLELNNRLKDNINRQSELVRAIDFLPKGHINTLYRNGKGYYYLTYREGKKIKNDYQGPVGKADLSKVISRLKLRQTYELELKELKKQEKELNKLIKKAK